MGITSLMKKSLQTFRLGLLVAGLFCLGSAAQAVTETITLPTTINVGDTSHDNNDLVIIGTTVTINGAHPFHSLSLQSGAVLNHTAALAAGMKLTIAQDLTIDPTSKINVSGQGFGVETGPGAGVTSNSGGSGGGYGGNGGRYSAGAGGAGYGSILQPTDLGSGGGGGYYGSGGSGGGSIRLIVGGTLQVDGSLVSNGTDGGSYGGGGGGGSVYLTAGTLSGSGLISARGGNRAYGASGGGGGRIALYANASSFPLANVSASGGGGDQYGGAGTIYTQFANQTVGNLIVANAGAGPTQV